jgi:hypothetical protein
VGAEQREVARAYLTSAPRTPQPRRMPGAVVFLVAVALIGAVGMLYLLQTNHVANLGYEMSQLQAEREAALVEQQQLSAQIAEKQALKAVESTARFEIGMRPIDAHVFLDVELPPTEPTRVEEPAVAGSPSTLERFWNRLTGSSSDVRESPADD